MPIEEKISELRKQLAEAMGTNWKLTDDEVVQISQQLDTYIVEMQFLRDEKGKKK
ncbi:aspartyl-phosphate phosphatase Spo0E family protein [Paenibacillus donghaensis]|uniref:aspartyl-phosphate phosphatase Spo0E family protein n=1 Tax=Paenibacillus donghaensis TaxID=414771 RepID=UPI0018840DEC|nr:aspartyl-phosphate phosphatase Spo0E family protein [Paenibacillus donghaensis]MBE9916650.1 aspartyl-phosphate phosphatase Spo0E family protein [Paenibacillus donghaensis]